VSGGAADQFRRAWAAPSAGSARAIDEPLAADAGRWGVSGGAADQFRRAWAAPSAGSARAIDEPLAADAGRWGVSGGAAFAPPDV
jgi:hypothetical protein